MPSNPLSNMQLKAPALGAIKEANNPLFMYGGVAIRDRQLTQANGQELKQRPLEFAIHNVLCAVDLGPRSAVKLESAIFANVCPTP